MTRSARGATSGTAGAASAMRAVHLGPEAASVPMARRFVREALAGLDLADVVDAAEICVSELVTNAVLHARTGVTVRTGVVGPVVRLEVQDGSTVAPRRLVHTMGSATGRGMELVALLARSWGVDLVDDRMKTVWCELATTSTTPAVAEPVAPHAVRADADADALLAAWADEAVPGLDPGSGPATDEPDAGVDPATRLVVLVGYPVRLGMRAREHTMAILRECALLTQGAATSSAPTRLIQLAQQITSAYAGELAAVEQQRADALARGDLTLDLRYPVRPDGLALVEGWQAVVVELDGYAAGPALLTQATPPDLVDLRDWSLGEFVAQLGGRPPRRWTGPLD